MLDYTDSGQKYLTRENLHPPTVPFITYLSRLNRIREL